MTLLDTICTVQRGHWPGRGQLEARTRGGQRPGIQRRRYDGRSSRAMRSSDDVDGGRSRGGDRSDLESIRHRYNPITRAFKKNLGTPAFAYLSRTQGKRGGEGHCMFSRAES
jgi:hypothetical protein